MKEAALNDPVGDGSDPVGDNALPDQVSQHPVSLLHGHIDQGLPDSVVGKGNLPFFPGSEFSLHLFIAAAAVIFSVLQGAQKIILLREAAEDHVAERDAVSGINIAEGDAFICRLQGNAFQHLVHVDLHKAGDEFFALKGEGVHRHGDDDLFVTAVDVQDRDLRSRKGIRIKLVIRDIVLHAHGSIDPAIGVHEGELFKGVQLFHPGLVRLQMFQVGKILSGHQAEG